MRISLFCATTLLSLPGAFAQQITNVTWTPNPIHACGTVTYQVMGTAPAGMTFDFLNTTNTATNITLVIEASGPGSGSSSFNNAVGPQGPYAEGTYFLSVSLEYNGVITSTWTDSITVLPYNQPDIGETASIQVCPNDSPFNLTSRLGGTPQSGGTWLSPYGEEVPNGQFIPGTSMEGDYLYYFPVPFPCEPEYQVLSIAYLPNTDPGADSTISLCTAPGAPAVDLFPFLGSNAPTGGTWSGPGGSSTGTFIPGTSQPGPYVYQVAGVAPCPDPTATVTVIGAPASNPGVGDSAWFCYNETAADLDEYLTGEAQNGIWYGPSGSGITFWGEMIDVMANGAGNYAYVVVAPPCPADTAYVYVTLDGPPCTLGIADTPAPDALFTLSPNPASDRVVVTLERESPAAGQRLEVLDVNGRVLFGQAVGGTDRQVRRTLDVSSLAPGAYLLRLMGGQHAVTRRLMVR